MSALPRLYQLGKRLKRDKSPNPFDVIRPQLEEQQFVRGSSIAAYDAIKLAKNISSQMSWRGDVFVRGNDQVALLRLPPRIGIIRDGEFIIEVPLGKYVENHTEAAEIVKMIGRYPSRPDKKPANDCSIQSPEP